MSRFLPVVLLCLIFSAAARSELPLVDRGELAHLRANCLALAKALDQLEAPLPKETRTKLDKLLADGADTPETLLAIQQVLDPFCLIGVTINPESRVKAARGSTAAELVQGQRRVFLVKVQNDAGVTQALTLTGPQLDSTQANGERWLRAAFHRQPPLKENLSGHPVEYLVLVCQSNETGKREAKLIFDVGQGTQDLGFRAEVPILFTIRSRP
jgi:hypothetical protein